MTEPVMAFGNWTTNAELIEDCARLGYLRKEWHTLDPTYGYGTFWKNWQPEVLVGTDLDADKSLTGESIDFTDLPFKDRSFDSVVFDGPYRLNGTPDPCFDERYGTSEATNWRDRMQLLKDGLKECARVLGKGYLLVKCQDQVVSGKIRWQTRMMAETAEEQGLGLVDRFDFTGYRPQPEGRKQVHARRNTSQLLVFKRGWNSR